MCDGLFYYTMHDYFMREASQSFRLKLTTILCSLKNLSIQQYEQRQKNINHASTLTLAKIAKQLYCNIEDLLEKI